MRSTLEVNLKTLSENIKKLSNQVGKNSFFCPMIKADAYGLGALAIAQQLQQIGITNIGVLSIEEALTLKSLAQKINIYIFGPFEKSQIPQIQKYHFIPVVGQWEDLKNLVQTQKKISFHIKFNLGMNRLGFPPSESMAVIEYIKKYPEVLNLTGICSHLNNGELVASDDQKKISVQIQIFKDIYNQFKVSFKNQNLQSHLLGSAAWLSLWSHSQLDSVLGFRPGICLYGIKPEVVLNSPQAKKQYHFLSLKEVCSLKSFIVQTRVLSVGQSVSYGSTWTAQKKSVLAVVSMGYADGLPYKLSNKAEVLLRGQRVPIVGRVCMDFFMIDITSIVDNQDICKGEEIIIFGTQKNNFISIEEQSKKADTLYYELLTGLGNRIQRIYLSGVQ